MGQFEYRLRVRLPCGRLLQEAPFLTPRARDLGDIIEREHEKARLIVLRGNGDDFCAGRFNTGGARPNAPEALEVREFSDHVFRCYGLLRRSNAPVIAQVQGRCMTGGLMLAWCSDLIIASDDAQRFTFDMQTHYLAQMGELISLAMLRVLKA